MSDTPDYNYLDSLNPAQRSAVEYNDGPALVIAGAGSGKTRVLTYKIVHLIRMGYQPYRILALTFTNKAAREMKERITQIVGEKISSRLWMGTFHSIFLRILRRHAELLGFKSNFTIYDTTDTRSLLKMIIKDMGLDDKIYKPASIASRISNQKNALIDAQTYMQDDDNRRLDAKAKIPMFGRIFSLYEERCRINGAMDFDDILFYTNVLLRDNPDVCRHYQEFFRYILVDEYQDTNFAQHLIITQLTGDEQRLCVVGDDAQSIYSFRGANISNILEMKKRYPRLQIFKLERNYRSTKNIVGASGSLIDKNTRQMKKQVYSEKEQGDPIMVMSTYSDIEEAYQVANLISATRMTHHDSLEEYAVLYRTNAQSRILEEALRKRNIPYRIYGGLSFYQRKEIKDAICYFRLAVNPDDDEALRRVINYPARGIGDTTLGKLQAVANEQRVSIWQVICEPDKYKLPVNAGTLRKLEAFRDVISECLAAVGRGENAYELGQLIYNRTGMLAVLAHDNTPESISRSENLTELQSGLKYFVESRMEEGNEDVSLQDFLNEVSLATDQDVSDDTDEPKVTLMTAHAAKGLEFDHIFIVGVEEELFPSSMSMDSMAQVEEERRLLYVAITRAGKTCVMTYASSRFRNGQTVMTRPSRFLSDIDRKYLKLQTSSDLPSSGGGYFVNPAGNYRKNYGGNSYGDYTGGRGSRSGYTAARTSGNGDYRSYGAGAPDVPGAGATSSRKHTGSNKIKMTNFTNSAGGDVEKLSQTADGAIRIGTIVVHSIFGRGAVITIENISGNEVMVVNFDSVGMKKLLRRFAKITVEQF